MKLSKKQYAEILKEYAFGEYDLERIYKFLPKGISDQEKIMYAKSMLSNALQQAYIALMNPCPGGLRFDKNSSTDAAEVENAIKNRSQTHYGIYADVATALDGFSTGALAQYYIEKIGDSPLRYYLEQQITAREISILNG